MYTLAHVKKNSHRDSEHWVIILELSAGEVRMKRYEMIILFKSGAMSGFIIFQNVNTLSASMDNS